MKVENGSQLQLKIHLDDETYIIEQNEKGIIIVVIRHDNEYGDNIMQS